MGAVVPHLVEEAYLHLPVTLQEKTFFTSNRLSVEPQVYNADLEEAMQVILDVRREIFKVCPVNSISQEVSVELSVEVYERFGRYFVEDELRDVLQVGGVCFKAGPEFKVVLKQSCKFPCPRCRLVQASEVGSLCVRCQNVVEYFYEKESVVRN